MNEEAEAALEALAFDPDEFARLEEAERQYWEALSARDAEEQYHQRLHDEQRWVEENVSHGRSRW